MFISCRQVGAKLAGALLKRLDPVNGDSAAAGGPTVATPSPWIVRKLFKRIYAYAECILSNLYPVECTRPYACTYLFLKLSRKSSEYTQARATQRHHAAILAC